MRNLVLSNSRSVFEVDQLARKYSSSKQWGMGAFIAVFDPSLDSVLMVKTGNYAMDSSGGTPWNLPGGGVELDELPSHAVLRELREETGLSLSSDLRIAAWLERPYFQSRYGNTGELIILFCGIDKTSGSGLRPAPPEIINCGFYHFDLDKWLRIPTEGNSIVHPLAPLPRHWIYWTLIAQMILKDSRMSPVIHEYVSAASMAFPPGALSCKFRSHE